MSHSVTSEDERYATLYDVAEEAAQLNNSVDIDPYPEFARLLAIASVHKGSLRSHMGLHAHHPYTNDRPYYCVLSFSGCEEVFRDNETFSSRLYREMTNYPALGETILSKGGLDHRRMRATVQPMFLRPRAFNWWQENWINEIVEALMGHLETLDRADLNQWLCARLPIHTVTRAFGIKGEEALAVRFHLIRAALAVDATPEEKKESLAFVNEKLLEAIGQRRAVREDDVISKLIDAHLELPDGTKRPLTDEEVQAHARLILIAGGGTTWRQLGITLFALLTHPDQFDALRADRGLMPVVLDEALRWNPTDPVFNRVTTRDVELEGVFIPEGSIVEACLGSANRDPARYENPDRFDIWRKPQTHLAFTIGPHMCLGRDVARSEMTVALNALMDRFPTLRLDPDAPEPFMVGGIEQRGMNKVPVLLR